MTSILRIPKRQEHPLTRAQLTKEAVTAMQPPRILLAEDDAEMRKMLAEILEGEGYEVVQVEDGYELLDELAAQILCEEPESFDLVLSDIRLPGCSGLQVLGGLRDGDWLTPFLFITAFGDEATHAEAYRLGGVVLDKPFALDDLLDQVRRLVSPDRYREGWSARPVASA